VPAERIETERLVLEPVADGDLAELHAVYASNPEYLAMTEGPPGELGRYDLGMLERDVAIARLTPGRQLLMVRLGATGAIVGLLDWVDESSSDGYPWLGLVLVHADHKREGLATEAIEGLLAELANAGVEAIRAGVLPGNEAGEGLTAALGFEVVEERPFRSSAADHVTVLERRLDPAQDG
jgi:RimJ/RimL family protein N-acetyltransferase